MRVVLLIVASAVACDPSGPGDQSDAGTDGGNPHVDAGSQAVDGGFQGIDAGADAASDASVDAMADAGPRGACSTATPEGLQGCVDRARYVADVEAIAGVRPPGSEHHQVVRALCASRLESLGFDVELHDYGSGVNVVGVRPGTSSTERVLISAHYDGVPQCDAADDNATGVAAALETARVLGAVEHERTLVVACWDEEETGYVGSLAYATRAQEEGQEIAASFVFETIGYRDTTPGSQAFPDGFGLLFPDAQAAVEARASRGDFVALVADALHSTETTETLATMAERVGLPVVPIVVSEALKDSPYTADLRRSDHAPFWLVDAPGIMITDTADFRNDRYHCAGGEDTIEHLDHDFTVSIIQMTVGAAAASLGR